MRVLFGGGVLSRGGGASCSSEREWLGIESREGSDVRVGSGWAPVVMSQRIVLCCGEGLVDFIAANVLVGGGLVDLTGVNVIV